VKKLLSSESLKAFDVFTCMLKLNLPVVFGITVQLIPLNSPTSTLAISCVLFGIVQLNGRFIVAFMLLAVDMNEFRDAFMVKGWYCSVSVGVRIVSMSMLAVQPGSSIVMFSCGDVLSL